MNIPQILEVIVGLALTFYILDLVVSFITSHIMEALETRGLPLESYFRLRSIADARAYANIDQKDARADTLLITIGAVAQGSSFWYDILHKVKGDSGSSEARAQ